jgi:hypothetical protein
MNRLVDLPYHYRERFKARITFPDTVRTVIAPLLERHAVFASQCRDFFHPFEITISAKTPAVNTGTPSDVSKNFHAITRCKKVN